MNASQPQKRWFFFLKTVQKAIDSDNDIRYHLFRR